MKTFCPLVRGDCNPECLFKLNCVDNMSGDCELYDTIEFVRSLKAPNTYPDSRISEILKKLNNIEYNTGGDQTESDGIKSVLEDIRDILQSQFSE